MTECPTCKGCGEITNDEDRTPWKYWEEIPIENKLAIMMGIVKPIECPDCRGTGDKI